MTRQTARVGMPFLICLMLVAVSDAADAMVLAWRAPFGVGVLKLGLGVLAFLVLMNWRRLHPARAFAVPFAAFSVAVVVDFSVTVLATGRYIGGPPAWLLLGVAALRFVSGAYGVVVVAVSDDSGGGDAAT